MPEPTVLYHPADSAHMGGVWKGARAIVIHHTGGTDSLDWLSTSPASAVSVQRLVTKTGLIYEIVPDGKVAWHVGYGRMGVFERTAKAGSCNDVCLGIEVENEGDGRDPYPDEQVDAVAWQIAQWWGKYGDLPVIPHRLIDTKGKTDPVGLNLIDLTRRALSWLDQLPPPPLPATPYSELSPILASPRTKVDTILSRWKYDRSETNYPGDKGDAMVTELLRGYWATCLSVRVDPIVALGQMAHETDYLSAFWSAIPQRNPAGIGVNGAKTDNDMSGRDGWAFSTTSRKWEAGISFASWPEAVEAHVGRLLAYCIPAGQGEPHQKALIAFALSVRSLPSSFRGSVKVLRDLEGRWAPGSNYGNRIADHANYLAGL